MSVTDTSKSEINYFARRNSLFQRSSRNMLAASWLNNSGKRRCSLKRCMHFIHGSHGLESVSSSSLQPLPLASSLAPRHVPRTSPPPSLPTLLLPPSVTPLFEHKPPHPVLHSPPQPVPASPYARDAAGCYNRKPRRHTVNHTEQAHCQSPPQRRRVTRKKPGRRPVAASVSIATHEKRVTNTWHKERHYAPSVTLRQAKPLRTP